MILDSEGDYCSCAKMTSTDYRHNHYVPEWYQRRFMLLGQTKYFRLDLRPDVVTSAGHKYTRDDLHEWSPERIMNTSSLLSLISTVFRCNNWFTIVMN